MKQIGIFLIIVVAICAIFLLLLQQNPTPSKNNGLQDNPNNISEDRSMPKYEDVEELKIETLEAGEGKGAEVGDTVTVHYTGQFLNGEIFDSSEGRDPFSFTLGSGGVIEGWEQGLLGMQVGEIRRLTIPSDLGYGPGGYPPSIPGGAGLQFEVELLKLQ